MTLNYSQYPSEEPASLSSYPKISLPFINNPSRLLNFPILGLMIKSILVLPQHIGLSFLLVVIVLLSVVNMIAILVTGKYLKDMERLIQVFTKLDLKVKAYIFGLTNVYPGFTSNLHEGWELTMEAPQNPKRLFALPLIGPLVRSVLLLPYLIWMHIVEFAATIGYLSAQCIILFTGKYHPALFEINRDSFILKLRSFYYFFGMSDKYPSLAISWSHREIKIILIVLGALLFILTNLPSQRLDTDKQDNERLLPEYKWLEEFTPETSSPAV